jgi:hypothetical protein
MWINHAVGTIPFPVEFSSKKHANAIPLGFQFHLLHSHLSHFRLFLCQCTFFSDEFIFMYNREKKKRVVFRHRGDPRGSGWIQRACPGSASRPWRHQ